MTMGSGERTLIVFNSCKEEKMYGNNVPLSLDMGNGVQFRRR